VTKWRPGAIDIRDMLGAPGFILAAGMLCALALLSAAGALRWADALLYDGLLARAGWRTPPARVLLMATGEADRHAEDAVWAGWLDRIEALRPGQVVFLEFPERGGDALLARAKHYGNVVFGRPLHADLGDYRQRAPAPLSGAASKWDGASGLVFLPDPHLGPAGVCPASKRWSRLGCWARTGALPGRNI
jgi:hypothetical protein